MVYYIICIENDTGQPELTEVLSVRKMIFRKAASAAAALALCLSGTVACYDDAYVVSALQYKIYGNYQEQTKPDPTEPPAKVTGLYASETKTTSIRLCWDKIQDADGYSVYLKQTGGYQEVGKTDAATYNVTGLLPSWRRHFIVRAYKIGEDGTFIYGPYSDQLFTATCADTVTGLKATKKTYNSVTLSWNRISCNMYIVYQMKNGKWQRIAKPTTNSYTVTGLSNNTSYNFVIRACKLDDYKKEHLGWLSNKLTVTTPKNTIVKKNGVTYVNGILIANKTYGLPSTYNPGGLTKATYNAFLEMKNAAAKDGISLWICSGFRSYSTQSWLYNSYVNRDGRAKADTYSARPGYSEHQTGLAMDINNASSSFNNTREARWLANNCWKYGFIIRYPNGKQNITGYKYESWHVRYLGKDMAKKVYDSGLCLEEYLGITSRYK
jgi:LAS superfamily LD-carboxypeptidase LdcB